MSNESKIMTPEQKIVLENFMKRVSQIQWDKSPSHSILSSSIALFREFWRRHKILAQNIDFRVMNETPKYVGINEEIRSRLKILLSEKQLFTERGSLTMACLDDILIADDTIHTAILYPSEPIIRFYERGARFRPGHSMVDIYAGTNIGAINNRYTMSLEQLNRNPLTDLSDEALNKLDEKVE